MTTAPMAVERMAALREALAGAADAAERLPVLAEMVELAVALSQAGDGAGGDGAGGDGAGGDGAACVAAALDEALPQLKAAAESLADDGDYVMSLYLIAQACLLRDSGSDLDDAIGCLRELRDLFPAGPADDAGVPDLAEIMAEIEARLGLALVARASRPGGGVTDIDDASAALTAALERMPSDAPGRPALTAVLALQHATRYGGYSGTQNHREAALARAAECLAAPGAAQDTGVGCHLVIAWMTLTRQMTGEQRSLMLGKLDVEAARRGEPEATAMIAAMGEVQIDLPDAETALSHLRQIPGAALDGQLRATASGLSGLAQFAIMRAGGASEDADLVAEQLQDAARQSSPDMIEQRELLAIRAALLAVRASGDGHQDTLSPAVEALKEAAAGLPEGHLFRPALLNQLGQSLRQQVDQAESADDVAAEVERIMDTLEQMPHDDPQFARALTFAAVYLLGVQLSHRAAVPLDRVIIQLDRTVKRLGSDDPMRFLGESMYWSAIGTKAAIEHRPDRVQAATAGLLRCADRIPADSAVRPLVVMGAASSLMERYVMTGELRLLKQTEKYMEIASEATENAAAAAAAQAPGLPAELSMLRGLLIYLQSYVKLARVQHEWDGQDLTETVTGLERVADVMKPLDPLRSRVVVDLETVRAMRELLAPSRKSEPSLGRPEREAFEKVLAEVQNVGRDHHDFPALAAQAAAGLMLRGIVDGDKSAMGQAISLLGEACSVPGLTYRERPRMLTAHGSALLTRYDLTREPRDLSHAIDRLEEARRAVEQELGSPYAATVLQSLASAYRIRGDEARGDVDRAVTVGLDALREHAGDVLLQDDDENALRAARRMTSDAGEMARWFLRRGRPGAAIEALEFGRGTVLHAATSGARLAEALEDAGHADLAAEWALDMSGDEANNPDAAGDLRYRIMMAIEGSPAEARLLAPPSLDEIKAALAASGVDTLVYLLPRGDDGPGLAVLVDSGGTVEALSLPGLRAGTGTPVGAFLQARRAAEAAADARARKAADLDASAEDNWREALGEVCDWAWRTAIGPVLDAVRARARGSRRVVLVPGGELGLVAWHAARQPIRGGYRYAAQEAVFSYASSARQFVDSARQRPRPWAQAPVLISDSAASLHTTAVGICHLHAAHYPAASVFGYARIASPVPLDAPGSAVATPDDVLDALPHRASPGASLLHFGCHGTAQVPVLASHLQLGLAKHLKPGRKEPRREDDEKITVAVRDILRRARKRPGEVSGGLVVLASCLTDVAEADYDEAVTLATAFLSAGAAGVVAARWKVADRHTAPFMAAFHHYLNGSDRYPAQALRSAQIWMLDPGREPLGPLPPMLSPLTAQADLADPVAWAGFAYQGW